nr:unnamed protein product [Spirometra erinaceieuropaei]
MRCLLSQQTLDNDGIAVQLPGTLSVDNPAAAFSGVASISACLLAHTAIRQLDNPAVPIVEVFKEPSEAYVAVPTSPHSK